MEDTTATSQGNEELLGAFVVFQLECMAKGLKRVYITSEGTVVISNSQMSAINSYYKHNVVLSNGKKISQRK